MSQTWPGHVVLGPQYDQWQEGDLVPTHPRAVILDVDGTLVDTNYHHALAWFRALRNEDVTVPAWELHRAIGMGWHRTDLADA